MWDADPSETSSVSTFHEVKGRVIHVSGDGRVSSPVDDAGVVGEKVG